MKRKIILRKIGISLGMLALTCVAGLNGEASAQVTNLVSYTTFETDPPGQARWPWAYTYGWGSYFDPQVNPASDLYFMYPESDPTNTCEKVTFDLTSYTAAQSDGGYGLGFGAGMNWSSFDPAVVTMSTNRADYILSFDAKAEGMLAGVSTITGQMQVQMDAPDDTIQPPDADYTADRIIQINKNVDLGSNWTHFEYTLDNADLDGGTPEKNLVLHGNAVNSVNFNLNFDAPGLAFGYDADNAVYLDNIKLQVIQNTNPPPPTPPKVNYAIVDWNFDDKPLWYSWAGGGWAANGVNATYTVSHNEAGVGVGGSNAFKMGMDNRIYAGSPPSWAGGNVGGGGPGDYRYCDSPNLSDYVMSFDAKVEGLAPDKLTTSGCLIQLSINAPDDTLQPADGNTDNDQLVRLDFGVADLETNWQHQSFLLSKGTIGAGTKENFTSFFNKVSEITLQAQIVNAASETDWAFDGDNVFLVDNFKIERAYVGCPPLTITSDGQSLTATWNQPSSGTVKLLSASAPVGPWTEVKGASSPFVLPTSGAATFLRTLWVPPTP